MIKKPIETSIPELMEILKKYISAKADLNYAVKIIGHPGVGKSAVVKEAAEEMNYHFIDTRLAFKENIDLGGYPVPDHEEKRMIYYRPRFIPPEAIPEGRDGILWFLDESNRAHPTVIQTLFQIITENTVGEHQLPAGTSIVLAGNLGEEDATTITDFDDSALDGRLAIFHLKPSSADWLIWAAENEIHESIIRYISAFPGRLWDEKNINPNPRGWEQISNAIKFSYGLKTSAELETLLSEKRGSTLEKVIMSLIGIQAGDDFIRQITSPRAVTTEQILAGDAEKLSALKKGLIPAEDLLWAIAGAVDFLRSVNSSAGGSLSDDELYTVANFLLFASAARGDIKISALFLLMKECGIFTQAATAASLIKNPKARAEVLDAFAEFIRL